jgi:hypothetical protein
MAYVVVSLVRLVAELELLSLCPAACNSALSISNAAACVMAGLKRHFSMYHMGLWRQVIDCMNAFCGPLLGPGAMAHVVHLSCALLLLLLLQQP